MKKILCIIVTLILAIGLFAVFVSAATVKTTFDLSTLDLSAGEHTITVKAKADGYLTSAASADLTYTVSMATAQLSYYYGDGSYSDVYYSADGGEWINVSDNKSTTNIQCSTIKFKIGDYASSGTCAWVKDVNNWTGYESFCCVDGTCIDYTSYENGYFYTDEIPITGTVVIQFASGSFLVSC